MATEIKFSDDSIRVLAILKRYPERIMKEVRDEMDAIAQDVRSNIMDSMRNTARAGRFRGKRQHQASAPNNPPAIDTGRLVGSFEILTSRNTIEIGTNVLYAKFLEKGTKPHKIEAVKKKGLSEGKGGLYFGPLVNHPGFAPRPFLEGGMKGINISQRLEDAVQRGFKQ